MYRWLKNIYKSGMARKMMAMVVVAATIYMIWSNINSAYWDQVIMTVDKIVQEIKYIVKHGIIQIVSTKVKEEEDMDQ